MVDKPYLEKNFKQHLIHAGRYISTGELYSVTGGGDQFSTKVLGSNSGGIRAGGGDGNAANILEEGDSMILQVDNKTNNTIDVSIDIDWYEVKV